MSDGNKNNLAGEMSIEVQNISELLAHALALEEEATERYADLAELMETHNNLEVAELFKKMADIEKLHVDHIREMIASKQLPELPNVQFQWIGLEGPESTDPGELHYLMTPHQALSLALLNEQRAEEFYLNIVKHSSDNEVIKFAEELAEEEKEHVALVKAWQDKIPKTEEGWDYDDDPPVLQD